MFKTASFIVFYAAFAFLGTHASAFDRLSESSFQAQVVGKTLNYKRGGELNFAKSGTITGAFSGGPASGSWFWKNGKVCSKISIGAKAYPQTCRSPETAGSSIRFVQDDGKVFGEAEIE